jgi:hypothetical protein
MVGGPPSSDSADHATVLVTAALMRGTGEGAATYIEADLRDPAPGGGVAAKAG